MDEVLEGQIYYTELLDDDIIGVLPTVYNKPKTLQSLHWYWNEIDYNYPNHKDKDAVDLAWKYISLSHYYTQSVPYDLEYCFTEIYRNSARWKKRIQFIEKLEDMDLTEGGISINSFADVPSTEVKSMFDDVKVLSTQAQSKYNLSVAEAMTWLRDNSDDYILTLLLKNAKHHFGYLPEMQVFAVTKTPVVLERKSDKNKILLGSTAKGVIN